MDELVTTKINNNIRKEFMHDYEELLSMIKMLNKNKVLTSISIKYLSLSKIRYLNY